APLSGIVGTAGILHDAGADPAGAYVGRGDADPGSAPARRSPPPGGALCAGIYCVLAWRAGRSPRALGAGHCPLRPPAASRVGFRSWRLGPWGALPRYFRASPGLAGLSGPGPAAELRRARPGPAASVPL